MIAPACARCGQQTSVDDLAETAMQADDVEVRVAGLARARCPDGHVNVVPGEAGAQARAAVDGQLQVARSRGLVRRRDVCGDCGAELTLPPRRSEHVVPVDVDGRVLTIVVRAPMVRCPACARDQLVPAAGARLPAVVDAAVHAASDD